MQSKFASYSFGCRVNAAEMQKINQQMIAAGFIYDDKHPDFFIINSCAVTSKAEKEVRQFLSHIRKNHPNIKIICTGCAVAFWKKNNIKNKNIDLIIDN